MNDSRKQTHLGRSGIGTFTSKTDVTLILSASSAAQMSGVNDDCYIHYYIQQQTPQSLNQDILVLKSYYLNSTNISNVTVFCCILDQIMQACWAEQNSLKKQKKKLLFKDFDW